VSTPDSFTTSSCESSGCDVSSKSGLSAVLFEKVGRSTGWSGGTVIDGCVDVTIETGHTIRCTVRVNAIAGRGDSGAPMFRILSGGAVELRGMLLGGIGQCWTGGDGLLRCTNFIANNLGGIIADLDPNGNEPLTFHLHPGRQSGMRRARKFLSRIHRFFKSIAGPYRMLRCPPEPDPVVL
jgi:hypothetical protein